MEIVRSVAFVAAMSAIASGVASAQPPACPGSTTVTTTSGTMQSYSSITVPINLAPCETVKVEITTSSSPPAYPYMEFRFLDQNNASLDTEGFTAMGTSTFPYQAPWVAPMRGTRGWQGLPITGVYYVGYTYFGRPVNYTLKVTKTPRPQYNIGGIDFGDAPMITTGTRYYGSLVPAEAGQFYKIHLDPGQLIYFTGQAEGHPSWGPAFYIDLHDANQQFIKSMVGIAPHGVAQFPSNPTTYVNNTGAGADFYVRARTLYFPTHDFQFVVETPTLTVSPNPVPRGSTVTFTIAGAPSGTAISNWKFVADITGAAAPGTDTITRTTETSSTTWSGQLVAGGTGSVSVGAQTISASVDIAPRSWFSPAKPAIQQSPGYQVVDPYTNAQVGTLTTTDPGTGGAGVGKTIVNLRAIVTSAQVSTVTDEGPNKGLRYLADISDLTTADWALHPDVDDPNSDWFVHQYGNWVNAPGSTCQVPISANPDVPTFISGQLFSSGVHRHEADPNQNSHYYYYVSSQDDQTINFARFAENQLGYKAYAIDTFVTIVIARLGSDAQAIADSINSKGEPCSQHCTADCQTNNGPGNIRPYR